MFSAIYYMYRYAEVSCYCLLLAFFVFIANFKPVTIFRAIHWNVHVKFVQFFSENNKCTIGVHNCHEKAKCTNTLGSYSCACNPGYHGNGVMCKGWQMIEVTICFPCFHLHSFSSDETANNEW